MTTWVGLWLAVKRDIFARAIFVFSIVITFCKNTFLRFLLLVYRKSIKQRNICTLNFCDGPKILKNAKISQLQNTLFYNSWGIPMTWLRHPYDLVEASLWLGWGISMTWLRCFYDLVAFTTPWDINISRCKTHAHLLSSKDFRSARSISSSCIKFFLATCKQNQSHHATIAGTKTTQTP